MKLGLVFGSVVSLVALSLATGCASRPAAPAQTAVTSAEFVPDASWMPGDQSGGIAVDESKLADPNAPVERRAPRARREPAPNGHEAKPGSVHAAVE